MSQTYDTKDPEEIITFMWWLVHQNTAADMIKIHQSKFVRDLMIEEGFTNYNANVILMKASSSIKMTDSKNYKEANLHIY